jgi:hypothetical protein
MAADNLDLVLARTATVHLLPNVLRRRCGEERFEASGGDAGGGASILGWMSCA